ncbi:histidine kinase dimerization/phosphoacceptor domain -containing protein [Leptospira yasudae]|uniref:histidine kinase dimerization/phosphoacceptor domain -containing protein n=1 Tax=Leptospira yasudae TaxID=2202201 RepID=UPI0010845443|nr:histidine kinase dimerization/phosphoacceptor domain -containing protein [Leptospira yasudae]MBW0435679.1 response regulator [Leptospira yasudae]TGK24620.1 response regulator [Leptospira yasudae]TGM07146.1 response regulator [Leptospira yasudae]TGM96582.1 response regulator [Leptospira yasudae]
MESRVKILIVDDNQDNLWVMEKILANPELDLIKASSGEEALKALLNPVDFALIFMDIYMPGMDGFETASLIRQREKCASIPIIFLTAYATNETWLFKGYSLGAVDFLIKPIAPEILTSKASVFVDLHRKNKTLMLQEELLRESHDQLEQRVEERTSELNRVNRELLSEIAERERMEEALKNSLQEKEVLLREIHHRVKNNLQIVSSILSLQGNYITDGKSLAMFEDAQSRIRSIALIHELLYQSKDLARMDFKDYLENLVKNLFRTYRVDKHIEYDIEADTLYLSLDTAIHCGLIVTELVTNAFKYGFKDRDKGKISIKIKGFDDGFVIVVQDDGVGFPEGLDFNQTDSLGLKLVNILSQQIGANLELERSNGTKFTLTTADMSRVKK